MSYRFRYSNRSLYITLAILVSIIFCADLPVRSFAASVPLKDKSFCASNNINYVTCGGGSSCSTTPGVMSSTNMGSGGGGSCGEKTENSQANKDQIWSYFNNKFREAGYSQDEAEKATSGIMGNWQQESGFNPDRHNAPNPGSGCAGASGPITGTAGMGIAQWCGGRQQDLQNFATDRGTDSSCLSTQLEFTWQEMGGLGLDKSMKGLSPRESSQKFDEVFEVSVGSGERQTKGENIYQEYTGKNPGSVSSNSNSSTDAGNCPSQGSNGPLPSANCKDVQSSFNNLESSGKIISTGSKVHDDINKCSDQKLERCSKDGGARTQTIRGIDAIAQNSGVSSITVLNINEDHGCDEFDHPIGLATDLGKAGSENCTNTNPVECKKMFDYIIANGDELGVSYVMWNGPYCEEKKASNPPTTVYCRSDHNDHIHVSFEDS
ncbi:MAG: phage tail tip lysozyme [Candidatus Saccharimonadales bacterium]